MKRNSAPKHIATFTLALVVLMSGAVLSGCSDDPLSPALDGSADEAVESRVNAEYDTPSVLRASPQARRNNDGEFASPLFGLATAPNGDVLVADGGQGITNRYGGLEVALPGVTDIAPIGRSSLWATVGLTGAPGSDTGQGLYRVSNGRNRMIANLFDFEASDDPDGAGADSNPFDVITVDGRTAVVADAGGNTLLRVSNQGAVEVIAVFPPELVSIVDLKERIGCAGTPVPALEFLCGFPDEVVSQAVPTSVALGPDGYYYVGELKGFPGATGESNVWRVAPDAAGVTCPSVPECVKAADGGFTSIIDLAVGQEGTLYVTELDENGWFALENMVAAGGTISTCDVDPFSCTSRASEVPIPTAVTVGRGGTEWVTILSLIPGSASVVPLD